MVAGIEAFSRCPLLNAHQYETVDDKIEPLTSNAIHWRRRFFV
jgi:hypothetical protein